ncbi:MAG: hypothetical protein ACTSRS_22490 [Candidatus Helarchaeota archaeon]
MVGGLIEEIKLRKYSYRTGRAYISVVNRYLKSGLSVRGFLLENYSDKRRSTMRQAYFALNFFYRHVRHQPFDEETPLTKKKEKLPVVLSRDEVQRRIALTKKAQTYSYVSLLCWYASERGEKCKVGRY